MATPRMALDEPVHLDADGVTLQGDLSVPEAAGGVVLFAHGSGSSRHSPRNREVARALHAARLATLLLDLLTPEEVQADHSTPYLRFDADRLAARLIGATHWLARWRETASLRIGYYGASTGGGVALLAAAALPHQVGAVVSRGGRVDLAADVLPAIQAPTLLLAGGRDITILHLNEAARALMTTEVRLEVVPGAGHLFEEPGALAQVCAHTTRWFGRHLG